MKTEPTTAPVGVPTSAELFHALELAWGLIANASGGDWTKETRVWQDAAARWRDEQLYPLIKRFGGHAQARAGGPAPSGASTPDDWTSLTRDDLVLMASRLQAECDQLRAQRDCYLASREAYRSERDTLLATVSWLHTALASTTPFLTRLAVEDNPAAADALAAVQDALDATKETP